MNVSEKEKLYKAIGYQESSATTIYPETFIDTIFKFCLHTLEISVFDEEFTSTQKVLTVCFKEFSLELQRRLTANAIKYYNTIIYILFLFNNIIIYIPEWKLLVKHYQY